VNNFTQCYLPPDASEHSTACLNPGQTGQYSIYLLRRDGRLSWPSNWKISFSQ